MDFGRREAPSAPYVRYLVEETGILIDKPMCEKPKTVRTPANIEHFGYIIETNFA